MGKPKTILSTLFLKTCKGYTSTSDKSTYPTTHSSSIAASKSLANFTSYTLALRPSLSLRIFTPMYLPIIRTVA